MGQSMLQWTVDVMRLIFFHMFLNPSFKMTTRFANVARTTASISKIYILGKISNIKSLSHHIRHKLSKLCKEFCKKNVNIKLVFTSFEIKNYFSYKDPIPDDLKSFLLYKFTCASCSSSYIGETWCHFKTRIEEHTKKVNKSHIFKHLHSIATCFDSYNSLSFKIIDKANSIFDLKIKEALHIKLEKTKLKRSTKSFISHPFAIASIPLVLFFLCFFSLRFSFIYYFHYFWH